MSDYKIAPLSLNDFEALAMLVNSAYRGDASRKGWTTEAEYLDGQRTDSETLKKDLQNPNTTILCLKDGEQLLGSVFLEKFKDQKGVGCYLGMLTVNPTLQTQGIGKKLMQAAEEYACQWGAQRMTLGVLHQRLELMAWYERRGYKRTGETKPFPYGDEKFGIPKGPDYHFIMFEKPL